MREPRSGNLVPDDILDLLGPSGGWPCAMICSTYNTIRHRELRCTQNVTVVILIVCWSWCVDTTRCSESFRGTEPRPQHNSNAAEYRKPSRDLRFCVGTCCRIRTTFAHPWPLWETKNTFFYGTQHSQFAQHVVLRTFACAGKTTRDPTMKASGRGEAKEGVRGNCDNGADAMNDHPGEGAEVLAAGIAAWDPKQRSPQPVLQRLPLGGHPLRQRHCHNSPSSPPLLPRALTLSQ